MPVAGTTFDYIKHLVLFEHDFFYKKKRYDYADVKHIHFFSKKEQEAPRTQSEITRASLKIEFQSGQSLRIKHQRLMSSKNTGAALKGLTSAAEALSEKTFIFRLEGYEKSIKETQAYPWGKYHIKINGDLLKGQKTILNLRENTNCYLYPFHATCRPAHENIFLKLLQYFKREYASFSLKKDRDCFLFLLKHYIKLSWETEKTRQKSGYKNLATPSLLKLAAHLSKADGHVSKQEIQAFKSYFNVTEQSHPQNASIFNAAKREAISVEAEATAIFKIYKNSPESLQHILKGFIYTALAEKRDQIPDAQMDVLTLISYYFKMPIPQFKKIYTDILKTEKLKQDFYGQTHRKKTSSQKSAHTPKSPSPLDVLGLPQTATWPEIKKTYRTLARRYHPDLMSAQGKSSAEIKQASEILTDINIAYTTLEKRMG